MTDLTIAELLDFVRVVADSGCNNYGDCRFHPVAGRCVSCQAHEILRSITYV